jgi:hypothetical protein
MIQFRDPAGNVVTDGFPVVGTSLRLSTTIGVSISGATSVQFGYRKPGTTSIAYWTAVVDDVPTGAIHYDVTAAQHDTAGAWTAWYKVVQSDGKVLMILAQSWTSVIEGSPPGSV